MKTRAAVLRDMGKDWEIIEMDLDPPRDGEVLIRFVAAGLCHSDDHLRTGDIPVRYPIVGGHEGAGVVEQVGGGVSRLKPGDHVVCSFLPTCGHCRFCASGATNLCDLGALFFDNCLPDGTFRFHADGEDFGQMCLLGTFSQRSVVSEHSCIKIDDDLPLETVALVGCGVPTGWGTAVNAGGVRPGDTTMIYGIGGVGINAVQGAAFAGARNVIAVDPLQFKRENAIEFGATHVAADATAAQELVTELTRGVGADQALITVGVVTEAVIASAFAAVRKRGTVVITGLAGPGQKTIQLPSFELTRPLWISPSQNRWCDVLMCRGAGLVNRHYHPQQVFAYTISGKWGYLEHDWVATAGDWVYEAPGESHTLVAYDSPEPMRVTFNVTGPLIWLDENGEPNGTFDVFDYIALCRNHYDKSGIGADCVDKLFR